MQVRKLMINFGGCKGRTSNPPPFPPTTAEICELL